MIITKKTSKDTLKSMNNKHKTKQITLAATSVICLVLNFLVANIGKNNPEFIEDYYSRGFYKGWSYLLTLVNRIIPFSLSEITYLLMIVFCLFLIVYSIKQLITKQLKQVLTRLLIIILILSGNVLYYQLSWGLNNYRQDVETLFELSERTIEVEDLAESFEYLIIQSNKYKKLSNLNDSPSLKEIMNNAYIGFETLHTHYDFIDPTKSKVKPLLISSFFSSSGYTGIYLPLFSEANINVMPHISSQGFTASHELSHQKGFASEDEANFLGFLACISQEDPYFKYSGYQSMMVYIGNSLYKNDQELYYELAKLRNDDVTLDIILRREFWDEHIKETTSDVHNKVNDAFLKANNQPDGIVNYSKVTEIFVKAYKDGLFGNIQGDN